MTILTPHSTEYMAEKPTNAHATTAFGIASALTSQKRTAQTVTRVASRTWGGRFGGKGCVTDVIILIGGQYFDVSLRQYDALLGGVTPFEMNLDALSDEDCEAVDNSTYWPED
jgi:hypothetical protein